MSTVEQFREERIAKAMDVIDTLPVAQAFPILMAMCVLDMTFVAHPRLKAWAKVYCSDVAALYQPGRPQ